MAKTTLKKKINLSSALMAYDRDMERLEIGLETIDSLSALRDEVKAKESIDEGTAAILAISVESLLSVARIGQTSEALGLPTFENYQTKHSTKEQCLEKFDEGIKKILSGIIEALKKAFRWIFGLTGKLKDSNDDDRDFARKLKAHAEKLEDRGIDRDPKKPMESALIKVEERRGGLEASIKNSTEVERIYRDKLFSVESLTQIEADIKKVSDLMGEVRIVFDDVRGYYYWDKKLRQGLTERKKDDLHKRLTNGQDLTVYLSSPVGYGQAFYIVTSLNPGTVSLDRYVQDFAVGTTSTDVQKPKNKEIHLPGTLVKNYQEVAQFFAALVETEDKVFLSVEAATAAMEKTVAQLEAEIAPQGTMPDILKKAKDTFLLAKKLQAAPLMGVCKQLEVMKIQAHKLAQGLNAVI